MSRLSQHLPHLLGVLMFFIWPSIQAGIYHVGGFVTKNSAIGTFVYGFILRLLGPLGLHHIFYLPFWQTALGGTLESQGHLVQGTQNIFFAQLGDPDATKYYSGVTLYVRPFYYDDVRLMWCRTCNLSHS
ncbi:PTS transporter subunit EIIC [Staphylococcus aureus]